MKAIASFIMLSLAVCAEELTWDDTNPTGSVKKFRVWKEVDLGVWEAIATTTENKWNIALPAGVHRLSVSAVGSGPNEVSSALSEPVTLTVLVVPANVRIEK